MKTISAVLLGKLILFLSRLLKIGGGSAAPGLYALKIDKNLVERLTKQIPKTVIITGTNGKTTTARMVTHFAKEEGLKVIRNHTGSNMERGIASTLVQNYGKKFDLAIWELDEASFNSITPKLNPKIVVFLNVSRDQLDRYGEVDEVVNRWCETVSRLDPKTTVLINSDDPNLDKLEKYFKGKAKEFGKKNIKNIKTEGLSGSSFDLAMNDERLTINLPLPGLYHIYDALAALAIAHYLGLPINKSFKNFQPAFGRFEKLDLPRLDQSGKAGFGYIFLIKNPAGATQVFETIAPQIKKNDRLLFALNDNLADGTDVSWIWDAQFENLKSQMSNVKCFIAGIRAHDLAVRLKYAGFKADQLIIEPDLEKTYGMAAIKLKGRLFILPTYTAMLELQNLLTKKGIKKHYWREA